ncbi:hypothetical protein BGZ98_010379 [Dissophora globulifera]|nr:hypothetical protein BGZ98_010379 [Dissophora globulifera]
MLQSLMVFPNNNNFFHMAPSMLDDNVAKLINTDQIENYMASASTSPIQDYLMAPTYHSQQQPQNQRQHQLQFPVSTSMITHSAPNSPPYPIIKTEDISQQQLHSNMDYLLFPSFDLTPASGSSHDQHHILPSQSSPQMQQQQQRMLPFADVSLIQQRQHHHQQQQQHAQQLRLHHQQRALEQQQQQLQHQQMMYDTNTPSHSAATSMSIPVTSMLSSVVSGASSSSSHYAPTAIATSTPFFHGPTLAQDKSSGPAFQRPTTSYTPLAHPAAPKRKREDSGRQVSPQIEGYASSASSSSSPSLVAATEAAKVASSLSTSSSNSVRSSSRKATKQSVAAVAAAAVAAGLESRESSEQPEMGTSQQQQHTGNITHPRRAAQNRAAQRTFRNRRKQYIKELEQKVQEVDRTRELMETIHMENQEVWRRFQILEALASQSGLQMPAFSPLTPFVATGHEFGAGLGGMERSNTNNGNATDGSQMMPVMMGSSNDDEEEDDDEMSDSYSTHIVQQLDIHQL